MKKINNAKNRTLVIATVAMLIAVGVLLPQAFHAVPNFGSIFLPMHIPVILCGMLCGPFFGVFCGVITPTLSWAIFGMPLAPNALVPMLFELATYGLTVGVFTRLLRGKKLKKISTLLSLPISMILGRAVAVIVKVIMLSLVMKNNVFEVFYSAIVASFVTGLPGIIIQLILIPSVILALDASKLLIKYPYGKFASKAFLFTEKEK